MAPTFVELPPDPDGFDCVGEDVGVDVGVDAVGPLDDVSSPAMIFGEEVAVEEGVFVAAVLVSALVVYAVHRERLTRLGGLLFVKGDAGKRCLITPVPGVL